MTQEITFPKRFKFNEVQKKWIKYWKDNKIYSFDIKKEGKVFSMDTPPPFVSGTLHLGHVLNHSWIDFVARYHKMRGDNVYFPQGFDCHGLPVELAVQKNYGISKNQRDLFLSKCNEWVEDNIANMRKQYDSLGYSTDWDYTYRTMDESYKYKVQKSLLDFHKKGWLYREKFPTHFCVNCETSVAKAEVGYEEEKGHLWYIKLPIVGSKDEYITIATTRPEYVEACVGIFVHPNDDRYYHLSAAEVKIPFTDRTVRVRIDKKVDMNFGTGIVYCCTYGDEMDIKWRFEHNLEEIQIFTEDGHLNQNSKYQGLTIDEARKRIVKDLDEMGLLEKISDYEHSIIVHSERSSCRNPIEYLPVYQWFIKIKDFTDEIIGAGEVMKWYPEKHKQRLIDWAEGLDWNWVISRQRIFGTPIPFWYCMDCGVIIIPNEEDLPLDPVKIASPVNQCPKCKSKNIEGEKDVCDCWIDSSITPLAIAKWLEDDDFFKKTYTDADVHRPQGYEIIRTWLFYTLFRCKKLTGKPPFSEIMINGMVAGPDSRKMSKSFGNIVSPDEVMPDFGADVIRQWAAMGTLGDDYPFEYTWINIHTKQPISKEKINIEKKKLPLDKFNKKYRKNYEQLIGAQRFLTKVWNAYRFLKLNMDKIKITDIHIDEDSFSQIDNYIFSEFNIVLDKITSFFNEYNWHEAFMVLRSFFWNDICDNYIEAIKFKFYLEDEKIRSNALKNALHLLYKILKIFAIFMPFISEEIYSIIYSQFIDLKSIHLDKWPLKYEIMSGNSAKYGELCIKIIKSLRTFKSKLQIPLNQEIEKVYLFTNKNQVSILKDFKENIVNTIRIKELIILNKSEEEANNLEPEKREFIEDIDVSLNLFS
ncbi:MAG: valine--tRNA ligase [Candidatus Lokiarchaeota archaeon]|nr:valine--tRNA ligase [Candidatus Lokiarchaeota archaeon]